MPVRSTMSNLIYRVRLLINDPAGASQQFQDQDVQDILDVSRADVLSQVMIPRPTYSGSTIQFLDYFTELGDWEDDWVIKQFLINIVTPSLAEPIAGHWQFATTTLPPCYLTGKTYDVYRAAADLLERWSARWALSYNISVDGQSLQRSGAHSMLLDLAKSYRMQARPRSLTLRRSDVRKEGHLSGAGLGVTELDYMGSGNKGG